MVSDDLAQLSDRLAGHLYHGTTPARAELAAVAADLLQYSRAVRSLESAAVRCVARHGEWLPEARLARTAVESGT